MRTDIDIDVFKIALEKEEAALLTELGGIAHTNPQNPADWETSGSDLNQGETDPVDQADNFEEVDTNNAIVADLEARLGAVRTALKKIEQGTYGYCEISHEPIEVDRLEANPSARTCKKHLNDTDNQ